MRSAVRSCAMSLKWVEHPSRTHDVGPGRHWYRNRYQPTDPPHSGKYGALQRRWGGCSWAVSVNACRALCAGPQRREARSGRATRLRRSLSRPSVRSRAHDSPRQRALPSALAMLRSLNRRKATIPLLRAFERERAGNVVLPRTRAQRGALEADPLTTPSRSMVNARSPSALATTLSDLLCNAMYLTVHSYLLCVVTTELLEFLLHHLPRRAASVR